MKIVGKTYNILLADLMKLCRNSLAKHFKNRHVGRYILRLDNIETRLSAVFEPCLAVYHKTYVQDMTKILLGEQNVQCLVLGFLLNSVSGSALYNALLLLPSVTLHSSACDLNVRSIFNFSLWFIQFT